MGTYTIGEVADRSGFSASALRYYEGIGLMSPTTRSEAGYRLYDERTLDRLAFIGRAKQLGCTLEEITELVAIWDGERCEPVQRRLHDLVEAKVADAQREMAELESFVSALRAASTRLGGEPVEGPCHEGCACADAAPADPPAAPAIACTLDPAQLPDRLAQWRSLLARARLHEDSGRGTVHLAFHDDGGIFEELARLVAAEQACCSFLSFVITIGPGGVGLDVQAPPAAADLVGQLFGPL